MQIQLPFYLFFLKAIALHLFFSLYEVKVSHLQVNTNYWSTQSHVKQIFNLLLPTGRTNTNELHININVIKLASN